MSRLIAKIKLAKGEVGYFDELTRIHLTLGRPTANIYDYMNTSRLRRSVTSKVLILTAGSLNPISNLVANEEIVIPVETFVETVPTIIPNTAPIIETERIESQKVEVVEEVVAEEKKATKKKK